MGQRPVLVPEEALPQLASEVDAGQQPREGLSAAEAGGPVGGEDSSAAVSKDVERAIARAHRVADWLTGLRSVAAPRELDGRVVAAMNPGQRQSRAITALEGLARVAPPESLAQVVAAEVLKSDPQERRLAPSELDRLVEDRIAHPKEALIEGMVRRLPRVPAPSELDERVRIECAADDSVGERTGGRLRLVRSSRRVLAAAAAAALIATSIGLFRLAGTNSGQDLFPADGARDRVVANGNAPVVEALDGERIVAAAGGSRFRVVRVTEASMTDGDRAVLGALGLPVGGI